MFQRKNVSDSNQMDSINNGQHLTWQREMTMSLRYYPDLGPINVFSSCIQRRLKHNLPGAMKDAIAEMLWISTFFSRINCTPFLPKQFIYLKICKVHCTRGPVMAVTADHRPKYDHSPPVWGPYVTSLYEGNIHELTQYSINQLRV